jgi:hypothetical protein
MRFLRTLRARVALAAAGVTTIAVANHFGLSLVLASGASWSVG